MIVLILSILALFVGVGIYPIIKSRPSLISFFDAFVLISVIGLTLMHLIPHSVEGAGIWGMLAVCVGFGVPVLMHKMPHGHDHDGEAGKHSQVLLVLAMIGVITHTLLDGIGLSMGHVHDAGRANSMMLGLGVLFHRLPVGLFLGLMLIPRMGYRRTVSIAVSMAMATVLGFVLGHFALPMASLTLLNVIQGLIAGTLLHVVFHNVSLQGRSESPWPKGLGALFGIATLALIEILMPGHGHAHASVLETWLDYLWHAAPVWCAFAVILGIAYGIRHAVKRDSHSHEHDSHSHEHDSHSHDHHEKRVSWPVKIAEFICRIFDPQPVPALYDNTVHLFSAAGIVTLMTLFKLTPGAVWWGLALLCLIVFKLAHRKLHVCASCRPESLCNQHKSFGLWIATSWTQIACVMLLAAVLPSLLAPLGEWVAQLPMPAALGMTGVMCVLILAAALKKRSISLVPCLFGAFAALIVFAEVSYAQVLIALTGTALLCLYDYHPRDVHNAVDTGTPWLRRYVIAAAVCMMIGVAVCLVPHNHLISAHPHALAHFETHGHHHGHHSDAHSTHRHDLEHPTIEKVHGQAAHVHEASTLHMPGSQEHVSNIDAHHDHTQYIALRLPFLIVFILSGLFWLLRLGPRRLFETAMGKHHHDHEG